VADPSVLRKLQDEIDTVVATNPKYSYKQLPNAAIKTMPYLQACILEGLRVYPPVFSQLRERVAPPEGVVLNGYAIPGGTYVGLNGIGCQLSHIFGDDVEEFHPERWLINDEVRLKRMRRDLDLVFGYGNSKCLGINMANLELNKVVFEVCYPLCLIDALFTNISKVFRAYDISFCDKDRPWKSRGDFVLADFHVKLQRREGRRLTNGVSREE
jgi:cytochrome P450